MEDTGSTRLAVLVVVGLLLGACGLDSRTELPAPQTLDVILKWESCRFAEVVDPTSGEHTLKPVPVLQWHVEFRPDGTFSYGWRSVELADGPWRKITGRWMPANSDRALSPTWLLVTDGETQHVDNAMMGGGDLPMVYWTPASHEGGTWAAVPMWWIQAVDPDTGRFTDAHTPRTDPRLWRGES